METDRGYNREDMVGDILYPGADPAEQKRNKALLMEYDYEKYVEGLTGYAGQNLQQISKTCSLKAQRTRIGEKGHYKAGMAISANGTIFAAPCVAIRGEGPYDVTFIIKVYESADGGLTWKQINQTPLEGKEPSLLCLQDGTLILTAQPIVDGKMGYRLPVYRSADNGVTWSTTYLEGNRDYPRNLFVDTDGSVCFIRCSAVWFEFEADAGPGDAALEINRSYDGGMTWKQSRGKVSEWDYPGFMEVSSLRLPSGRLAATLRHQPSGTKGEGFENTLITFSEDNGLNWSKPSVISDTGEVHFHLLLLRDGRLLGTYSNYHLPYGVCAVLSEDEGRTWKRDEKYQLSYSADYYLGWGVTAEGEDGSLYTTYASTPYLCEPPDTTVCEMIKWQLK